MTQADYKVHVKIKAKHLMELTHRERQLIARLRQKRNNGEKLAEVDLASEDGPRVRETVNGN